MGKTINFTIEDKDYTLEYTRNTVIATERAGFNYDSIATRPIDMLTTLWRGAFLAHHATLTTDFVDGLLEKIDTRGILYALLDLYYEPIKSLTEGDNEENPKNVVKWTIN